MKYLLLLMAIGSLVISWLLPNHYVPWLASHSEFMAFLAALFLLLFYIINYKDAKIPFIFLGFCLLAIVPIIQYLFGLIYFFGDAFISSVYICSFFLVSIIGYNIAKDIILREIVFTGFCYAVVLSSVISVYISLLQWLSLTTDSIWVAEMPLGGRPFGNFAQPNSLATLLMIGVVCSVYLYEKFIINKLVLIILLIYLLIGIALTQSRTVWLAFPLLALSFIWYGRFRDFRFNSLNMLVLTVFYFLLLIIVPIISNLLGLNSISSISERLTTGHNRFYLWKQLALAVMEKPIIGYGWGQVSVAQVEITPLYSFPEWITHSHNIFIDLLIWFGIPLGFFIFILGILFIVQIFLNVRLKDSIFSLMMILVVLNHALFEFPLEYSFFLLPIGFLLGFSQQDKKGLIEVSLNIDKMALIFIISITLFFLILREYRMIEKDVQLARFELLNIGNFHAEQPAPNVIFLTQLSEQLRFMRTQPRANMTDQQLEWMHQVAYRYATQAALFRYAQALALNDHLELAKKQLLIIEKLHGKKLPEESLFVVRQSLAFAWESSPANSVHLLGNKDE